MFADDLPLEQRLYLSDRLLSRLGLPDAQATISALPAAEAVAVLAAMRTLDAAYRDVRRQMRALAVPIAALVSTLPPALCVETAHLGGRLSTDAELDDLGDDLEDDTDETDPDRWR